MTTLSGIDVSGENGEFPWGEHEGISFAGIRATSWDGPSSFTRDPQLDRNAPAVWDLGKNRPRIYYHETSPGVTSPKSQARGFLNALGGHLCDGDMLAAAMEDAQGEPPSFVANGPPQRTPQRAAPARVPPPRGSASVRLRALGCFRHGGAR